MAIETGIPSIPAIKESDGGGGGGHLFEEGLFDILALGAGAYLGGGSY